MLVAQGGTAHDHPGRHRPLLRVRQSRGLGAVAHAVQRRFVGDEQLAGHFAGISVLQGAIDGLRNGYRASNASAAHRRRRRRGGGGLAMCRANSHGVPIAYPNDPNRLVIGANYFQVQNGKIVYMRTMHDSLPFQPFLDQRQP